MMNFKGSPTMENYPPLPGNPKILVDFPAVEEFVHQARNLLFHVFIQDHIIPARILDLFIQGFAPEPVPIVNINPLVPWRRWDLPFPNRFDQLIRLPVTRHDRLPLRWLFEDVLHGRVIDLHDIDNEIFVAPLVEIFGKGARFANGRGPNKIACAKDGFVDYIEGGGCVAGKGESEEIDCQTIRN